MHGVEYCGLPGVCKDDVVARGVSAATTGRGRTSEAEFKDHVGGVVCRDSVCGLLFNVAVSKSPCLLQFAAGGRFLRVRVTFATLGILFSCTKQQS